jgi:phosphoenolpyruvate carboxykinase (GTP)
MDIDKAILDDAGRAKLEALKNPKVLSVVEEYVKLCKPAKVIVLTDDQKDIEYVRQLALKRGEERPLAMKGHSVHFDGPKDQGRDTKNTRIMLPKGRFIGKHLNTIDKEEGTKEVLGLLDGAMKGREMIVSFFCLGPVNSEFSISALQMTDSAYVVHSESMLYRSGYEQFKRLGGSPNFFYFVHSSGELDERMNTKNVDKRRIYMDLEDERVFTINNQYAGNSVGLKKLALRLAISKAAREDWLCEHMFVMGIHPEGKNRVTYFTGAFPSACGKTSTAMVSGQSIVGDDIAYLKKDKEGRMRAANVEQGIFGIIQDVSERDDPVIYKALTSPGEVIFSNVLIKEGAPYWLGMGRETPKEGENYMGMWHEGMADEAGKPIKLAHPNARYTIRLKELANVDPKLDDPAGVVVDGIIYGGRDSDTSPPVCQSLSWAHGVFVGAALESETTTATIGQAGVLKHDPMANIDFLVLPFGVYLKNHLKFGDDLDKVPAIFATNYFLKEGGNFLNTRLDKKVWLMWMEGRVHGEYEAIETPIGLLPKYEDVRTLFKQYLGKDYTKDEYLKQFSLRISKQLGRLDRIEAIYKAEEHVPGVFYQHIEQQRQRLKSAQRKFGKDVIAPEEFE